MPTAHTLALFSLAAVALIVIPGPAVVYIVAQSIGHGRRAGLVSALGIASGGLVHVIAAAVGISSLLVSSATAFTAVKIAGAVYLVGLGLKTLLSGRGEPLDAPEGDAPHPLRLYRDGVVVNVLNPKTALFFLAFLPQFVDPERGAVALQAVVLGLLFVSIALVSDSLYALAASAARGALRGSAALARARRWVSGSVLVLLGAATAKAT